MEDSQMTTFQYFWRCEHHPSAMENFFERRTTCELVGCHTQELKWYHFGFHPKPSWARVRIGV